MNVSDPVDLIEQLKDDGQLKERVEYLRKKFIRDSEKEFTRSELIEEYANALSDLQIAEGLRKYKMVTINDPEIRRREMFEKMLQGFNDIISLATNTKDSGLLEYEAVQIKEIGIDIIKSKFKTKPEFLDSLEEVLASQ